MPSEQGCCGSSTGNTPPSITPGHGGQTPCPTRTNTTSEPNDAPLHNPRGRRRGGGVARFREASPRLRGGHYRDEVRLLGSRVLGHRRATRGDRSRLMMPSLTAPSTCWRIEYRQRASGVRTVYRAALCSLAPRLTRPELIRRPWPRCPLPSSRAAEPRPTPSPCDSLPQPIFQHLLRARARHHLVDDVVGARPRQATWWYGVDEHRTFDARPPTTTSSAQATAGKQISTSATKTVDRNGQGPCPVRSGLAPAA